ARLPLGRRATAALALAVCLVPAWLFADPLQYYWVYGDDWEYVASSRTFSRAIEHMFAPHNVHVVPVWRIVSPGGAGVVAAARRLSGLQPALAAAAYGTFTAVLLLAGRLVARETGRSALAIGAMVALSTTSLMEPAGSWYAASQAAGAGLGVLIMLW